MQNTPKSHYRFIDKGRKTMNEKLDDYKLDRF